MYVDVENSEQFTGRKDKKGKEIYDGDRVKCPTNNYVVRWHEKGSIGYVLVDDEGYEYVMHYEEDLEVVGRKAK